LALADGLAAIAHIREHATCYGVNPQRIGIIDFSAGGTVAASVK
jgi:acetyl esterase/lipase